MTAFDAVILTGGASTRMGSDKALLAVDGLPLALHAANALTEAVTTTAVGGDRNALSQLGLATAADANPGEGPLGGIAQALTIGDAPVVVVVACDLPSLNLAAVRALVDALGDHDAAVAVVDGHRQPVLAAWRRGAPVAGAFNQGERSPLRLLERLDVVEVTVDAATALDLDSPEDVVRFLSAPPN